MSNDFQRYVQGQDDVQPQADTQRVSQVNVRDTVRHSTITDGVITDHASETVRMSSEEMHPFFGSGTFAATARDPKTGGSTGELADNTIVTIAGIEAPIEFFVTTGVLQKNADGSYEETGTVNEDGVKPAAEAASADIQPMLDDHMANVNLAIEAIPQENMDALFAAGASLMSGRSTTQAVIQKFSQASGLSPAEAEGRASYVADAYRYQAGRALIGYGLNENDMSVFHVWAMKNAGDQLHEAILKQVHGHDVSGYKALAQTFKTSQVPPIENFRKAGVPVRNQGTGHEVFLKGSWMSPKAAAKAGLC